MRCFIIITLHHSGRLNFNYRIRLILYVTTTFAYIVFSMLLKLSFFYKNLNYVINLMSNNNNVCVDARMMMMTVMFFVAFNLMQY